MKTSNRLILTTSPQLQPARKPRSFANLDRQRRSLYGRTRRYNTGKEPDSETGLYYFGARYLDPKTSRWLSGDPAMGEYLPSAPVSEEARKRNGSLPGMGGVFNYANLHAYHYAGNNPITYIDPDGRDNLFATLKSLFRNDYSSEINTLGVSASGTVTMTSGSVGVGVYINPRNDRLLSVASLLLNNPVTRGLGLIALATNVEEAGIYFDTSSGLGIGRSGSVSVTIGTFESREVSHGPYFEAGGSADVAGVSVGADAVTAIKGNIIGGVVSVGIGVGTPEGHIRAGVTIFKPIIRNENE